MGRWGQNVGQGILERLPVHKHTQQNNLLKKDDFTIKLVNNQLPTENRPRLQALANIGKRVMRGRSSATDPAKSGGQHPNPQVALVALHDACANRKSDVQVVKYLAAKHPDGARACKDGNLPLHTACANKASPQVIEYLLEAYPEATGQRNKRDKLPIHVAVECAASLDVIKLLVKADPDSLQVADYEITSVSFQKVWIVHKAKFSMEPRVGLPLHMACKFLANIQVIHYLITEYPDAARTKNKDGWLPVHYSCAKGASLQTVQYLMTACPSSLYERTLHYYEYPMHLAAGRMDASLSVVKYIQSRHSIACTQTKPNEGLYLTYYDEACLQSAPPLVAWFLADVCAKAAKGYAYVSTVEDPYN